MKGRTVATCLADVKEEIVEWVWPGRLALRKLSLIEGDPGAGKTTLGLYVAACRSAGRRLPGGPALPPPNVGIISDEDGTADTIVPRLRLAGADLGNVYQLTGETQDGHKRSLLIPDDYDEIVRLVRKLKIGHLHIDPLAAHAGAGVKLHNDQDVRAQVMGPLANVAEETGASLSLVRHPNKMTGSKALYRGSGSLGVLGAARFGFVVGVHPGEPGLRVLAPTKVNIGPEPPSLALVLEPVEGSDHARLSWRGEVAVSADEVYAGAAKEDDGAGAEVRAWLHDILGAGRVKATDVLKAGDRVGYSKDQVKRAKLALGVVSKREGFGAGSIVWWELPTGSAPPPTQTALPMRSMEGASPNGAAPAPLNGHSEPREHSAHAAEHRAHRGRSMRKEDEALPVTPSPRVGCVTAPCHRTAGPASRVTPRPPKFSSPPPAARTTRTRCEPPSAGTARPPPSDHGTDDHRHQHHRPSTPTTTPARRTSPIERRIDPATGHAIVRRPSTPVERADPEPRNCESLWPSCWRDDVAHPGRSGADDLERGGTVQ